MKSDREDIKNIEAKRLEQIRYIMEHWDNLPEKIQGRFEGIIVTAQDFLNDRTG